MNNVRIMSQLPEETPEAKFQRLHKKIEDAIEEIYRKGMEAGIPIENMEAYLKRYFDHIGKGGEMNSDTEAAIMSEYFCV